METGLNSNKFRFAFDRFLTRSLPCGGGGIQNWIIFNEAIVIQLSFYANVLKVKQVYSSPITTWIFFISFAK